MASSSESQNVASRMFYMTLDIVKATSANTIWTHHQKPIINIPKAGEAMARRGTLIRPLDRGVMVSIFGMRMGVVIGI